MKGFDAEFHSLEHYILVITERIWEGRQIDDIHRYYADPCVVETPSSVSLRVQDVVDGTRATLAQFPDRELLAEDVLVSGDEDHGFLSSHRIMSPMTHQGDGAFGPATGRRIHVRTVADCVCRDNRIVHEWLVRDQAAIARQIGLHEKDLAQRWLDERGPWRKPLAPPPPAPYRTTLSDHPLARGYAQALRQVWMSGNTSALGAMAERSIASHVPGGETRVGLGEWLGYWHDMGLALPARSLDIEHLAWVERPHRSAALAVRWRAQCQHTGAGRYGHPTGRPVEVMGITHAEFNAGRLVREWVLVDDVALWMQILPGPRQVTGDT